MYAFGIPYYALWTTSLWITRSLSKALRLSCFSTLAISSLQLTKLETKSTFSSLFAHFILWSIGPMFKDNIQDESLAVQLRSFSLKTVLKVCLSSLRIFTMCTPSKSSFFEGKVSCTTELAVHRQQLLQTFSFFYSFQKHPRTLQKELRRDSSFLECKYGLNWRLNYYAEDIARRYFGQFYRGQSKWPIYRPFQTDHFANTSSWRLVTEYRGCIWFYHVQ